MSFDDLIVDNFAGGGGASTGIEQAMGRPIDVALNHDDEACAMYRANHPDTTVLCQSVFKADPREIVREGSLRRGSAAVLPVGLAWFSPDCTDHSKAKGGAPIRNRHSRDLAWVVIHWAKLVGPRIIMMENVEEWLGWGPVRQRRWPDGSPMFDLHGAQVLERDPEREGETFRKWLRQFRRCGYRIEFKELRASPYGAPTIRKRLFVIARRDGAPIAWPAPTHGPGLLPYRTAAECIDWSIPCPSIFERKRPLAPATLRRIARGTKRYVIDAARPFIVPITHHGDNRVHPIDEPMRTVTTAHRGEHALIVPCLVPRYGERDGQEPRTYPVDAPAPTIVPTGNGGSLVAVHLTKFAENGAGSEPDAPLHTVMAGAPRHGVVAAHLQRQFGQSVGSAATEPVGTVTPGGQGKTALVTAFLAQHNGGPNNEGYTGRPADAPLSTTTTRGTQQQVAAVSLIKFKGTCPDGQRATEPLATVGAKGQHHALVAAFMQKYYSSGGQDAGADEPMHTLTAIARMGLVTVTIEGEPYVIVDIGMRMLTARELYNAQGFPAAYVIELDWHGRHPKTGRTGLWRLTKTAQIRMVGNSVCPPVAAAIVRANVTAEEAAVA